MTEQLLSSLFGCEISQCERAVFSFPTQMGGLNIIDSVHSAPSNYDTSRKLTDPIIGALKGLNDFDLDMFQIHCETVRKETIAIKESDLQSMFTNIVAQLDPMQQRAVERAKSEKMSSWLNVVPAARHQFDLSAQEFRDALAIRYKKPLLGIPPQCDGCSAPFDLAHALSCRKGGLVTQRHNEVRDAFGDLASLAWHQVVKEPVVREATRSPVTPALVADLSVRGVWTPQSEALFDIRIVDTDARSYCSRPPMDVLSAAEEEKKRKYQSACNDRRALFTPICVSVDGMMGKEAGVFVKRLADRLSRKWNRNYSTVLGWIRTHLTFAILRATILCLRGSRTKWRSITVVDGSPLDLIMC